ncbi:unnamed protein product, partial [Medioppia subpectinata]
CRCLLEDESALLKHECAYCLGQIQDTHAIPVLNRVLANTDEHPMVRHEAAEALGAIGAHQSLDVLKKYLSDGNKSVSETCLLAIQRIEYLLNKTKDLITDGSSVPFKSVDPVPPLRCDESDISKLDRYRDRFPEFTLLSREFRHEVAYVLGQMQNPSTVTQLAANLADFDENEMVRHECAEALGAIATNDAQQELNKYIKDSQRVVRESVEVALDMSDYNNSEEFQYANALK